MNRIKLGPLARLSPASSSEFDFSPRSHAALSPPGEHTVFVPLHYESKYAYPLVVWLHDRGGDESELSHVMRRLSLRNYVAVAPRGADPCGEGGFDWSQDGNAIECGDEAVAAAIDDATRQFNISSQRIFIAGLGTGGTMAFRIAFQRPEWFAGVLSLNGGLPTGWTPLSRLNHCRRLPIFWTQCRGDQRFSEAELAGQLRLLHIAGFQITLRQYPSQDLDQQILPDANRWMMNLVTQPRTAIS
jgi:phospholipase/carboxylesterase